MYKNTWFYSDTQQTFGPITKEQLVAMIQAGQLMGDHFIIPEGADEWMAVDASPFSGYLPHAAASAPLIPAHFAPPQPAATAPMARPAAVPQQRPAGAPQARFSASKATPLPQRVVKDGKGTRNLVLGTLSVLAAALGWHFLSPKPPPQRQATKSLESDSSKVIKVNGGASVAVVPSSAIPSLPIASPRVTPARDIELRPSREDGDPSEIRFINKLSEEVKFQLVQTNGKLADRGKLKAGKTNNQRSYIGHVWLITAQNGSRLGLVESKTDKCTVIIDAQGVQVQEEVPPTRESQQLISMVQFTGTHLGDAVVLLRQRVAQAGLNVQIELDPRVDPKAGSINLDAHTIPLRDVLDQVAYRAGARLDGRGSIYSIVPR